MEETPLASLSLTHVHYNPTDPLSYLSAWLALVPQALCVAYVTLIWATREAEVLLMFAGQMGCEVSNFVMKRIIKEERPKQMFGKGYGMPSSHAQFVAFFAVYLALFLLFRHSFTYSTSRVISSYLVQAILAFALCVGAAGVAISRIYLNYHTPRQVLAGCAAGTVLAFAWFFVIGYLRTYGWIDWALDMPVAQFCRIRDLVVSQDLPEAGWQQWKAKRKLNRGGDSNSSKTE